MQSTDDDRDTTTRELVDIFETREIMNLLSVYLTARLAYHASGRTVQLKSWDSFMGDTMSYNSEAVGIKKKVADILLVCLTEDTKDDMLPALFDTYIAYGRSVQGKLQKQRERGTEYPSVSDVPVPVSTTTFLHENQEYVTSRFNCVPALRDGVNERRRWLKSVEDGLQELCEAARITIKEFGTSVVNEEMRSQMEEIEEIISRTGEGTTMIKERMSRSYEDRGGIRRFLTALHNVSGFQSGTPAECLELAQRLVKEGETRRAQA